MLDSKTNSKMTNSRPLKPELTSMNPPIAVPMIVPRPMKAIRKDIAFATFSFPTKCMIQLIGVEVIDIAAKREISINIVIIQHIKSFLANPSINKLTKFNSKTRNRTITNAPVPKKPIINTGLIPQLSEIRPQVIKPPKIANETPIIKKIPLNGGIIMESGISSIIRSRIGIRKVPNDIMTEKAIQ